MKSNVKKESKLVSHKENEHVHSYKHRGEKIHLIIFFLFLSSGDTLLGLQIDGIGFCFRPAASHRPPDLILDLKVNKQFFDGSFWQTWYWKKLCIVLTYLSI